MCASYRKWNHETSGKCPKPYNGEKDTDEHGLIENGADAKVEQQRR
jgi:hypothetical protein